MKRYLLLIPLLLACSLWQPYGAMQAQPTQAATVTAKGDSLQLQQITPTPKSDSGVTFCTVTADFLNVRTGPGTQYPATSWLRAGEVVTIKDTSGRWLQTPAGWIHGSYCE